MGQRRVAMSPYFSQKPLRYIFATSHLTVASPLTWGFLDKCFDGVRKRRKRGDIIEKNFGPKVLLFIDASASERSKEGFCTASLYLGDLPLHCFWPTSAVKPSKHLLWRQRLLAACPLLDLRR